MRFLLGLSIAAAIALPIVGQQQQPPIPDRPKTENLVKELGILESGPRTGKIAEHRGIADHYYFDVPDADWIPDEFMSNPDHKIDPRTLKGYHLPPRIKEVKIVGDKRVFKAGETVRFEAVIFNKHKVNAFQLNYHGPNGRRNEGQAEFRGQPKETWKEGDILYQKFDGVYSLTPWAEPGSYLPLAIQNLNNELGHGKSYRSDYLPEMDRASLSFEVEENPNVDVVPPALGKLVLGTLDGSVPAKPYSARITDLIPIYAEITDDRSGVESALVTIAAPSITEWGSRRYSDIALQPLFGRKNAYVGYFRLNRWYEAGEYYISRVIMTDAAGNERTSFPASTAFMRDAKVNIVQNDADTKSPVLITLSLDRSDAKPGDNVKVTAVVADDKSGVAEVVVTVHSPNSIDKRRVTLRPKPKPPIMIKPAYDVQENIVEGTFTIHADDEPGQWKVERVVARDNANNYLDMVNTITPELEQITVNFAEVKWTGDAGTGGDKPAPAAGGAPKIRRVDMVPPHPPRGACLNCHEPQ